MKYEEFRKLVNQEESQMEAAEKNLTHLRLEEDFFCDRIFYQLVSKEEQEELLLNAPHVSFFDMAITFRYLFYENEEGVSSALIEDRHLSQWQITEEELVEFSISNTPRLFPAKKSSVLEVISEAFEIDGPDLPLYIYTNQRGINGAACLFYKDRLKQFASQMRENFYILPSSVHEVLLLSESVVEEVDDLHKMVLEANHTVVCKEDFLSHQVFYYDAYEDKIFPIP